MRLPYDTRVPYHTPHTHTENITRKLQRQQKPITQKVAGVTDCTVISYCNSSPSIRFLRALDNQKEYHNFICDKIYLYIKLITINNMCIYRTHIIRRRILRLILNT